MEFDDAMIPEDIPRLFVRAWNARSADGIANLFEEQADFINVVGIWWENKEDIRKAHDYGLRVIFSQSEIKLGKVKVKFLSDDIAVMHARMRLIGQTPLQGKQPKMRHNLFIFIVRRLSERWLCLSAQNTDVVPGAETHIRDEDGNLLYADYRE